MPVIHRQAWSDRPCDDPEWQWETGAALLGTYVNVNNKERMTILTTPRHTGDQGAPKAVAEVTSRVAGPASSVSRG